MKTTIKNSILVLLAIVFTSSTAMASVPLKLYYSSQRTDNFTTSSTRGIRTAEAAGYRYAGVEGYVESTSSTGRKPLKLYYHDGRKDNFLVADATSESIAKAGGYRFVRIEGYIYSNPGRGRKALKLYYNPQRQDNFTTASAKGEQNASNGGYRYVRTEGYVLTNNVSSSGPVVRDHRNEPKTNPAIPGRYNLPENLRPAFENMPIWRLQLKVLTDGRENAGTDDEVYVKFQNTAGSHYFLDRAGNDRERNETNVYDIVDPNVNTIQDIKMLTLGIIGDDGWCVKRVELLINDWPTPIFRKSYSTCQWLDHDSGKSPTLYISGSELRSYAGWRYNSANRGIWMPPTIIKNSTLVAIVESYVGHLMNLEDDLKDFEYGKKQGQHYVVAKKVAADKLHFDLDLAYTKGIDLETDLDFDMLINCQNNNLSLQFVNVKGQLEIPIISSLVRVFKKDFASMKIDNFGFQSQVPLCPSIRIDDNGNILLRP